LGLNFFGGYNTTVQVKGFWMTSSGPDKKLQGATLCKKNQVKIRILIGLLTLLVGKLWPKKHKLITLLMNP